MRDKLQDLEPSELDRLQTHATAALRAVQAAQMRARQNKPHEAEQFCLRGADNVRAIVGALHNAGAKPSGTTAEAIVRSAFRVMADSGSIARTLDHLRLHAPEHNWNYDKAKRLLQNEIYRGVVAWGRNRNENIPGFDPIVDEDVWEKVQELFTKRAAEPHKQGGPTPRARRTPEPDGNIFSYLLRGLVRCAHCDCLMTPASHKGATTLVHYYECSRQKYGTAKRAACPIKCVNARALHQAVLDEIERCATHPTRLTLWMREAAKAAPDTNAVKAEIALLTRNRRETEKKRSRLVEAIKAGIPASSVAPEIREMTELAERQDAVIEQAKASLIQIEGVRPNVAQITALWSSIAELWDAATDDERHRLFALMVERIEMKERRGEKDNGRSPFDFGDRPTLLRGFRDSHGGKLRHKPCYGCRRARQYHIPTPDSPSKTASPSLL